MLPHRCLFAYSRFQPRRIYLPIIIKVKFVTATKFHYRVLQLTAVFLKPLEVTFISLVMVHLIENFTYAYINSSTYSTSLNKFNDMKLEDLRNVFLSRVFEKINMYKTLLCAVFLELFRDLSDFNIVNKI